MKVKATVNGTPCIVYDYINTVAGLVCMVKYECFDRKLPVLAQLIRLEAVND